MTRSFCLIAACTLFGSASLFAQAPLPPSDEQTHVHLPPHLNPPAAPITGQPINDRAVVAYLEIEGRKLINEKRTLTNWNHLLDDRWMRLKLPEPSKRKLDHAGVAARMEAATGVLGNFYICDKCSKLHVGVASGFFIHKDGAFVTCRHVLNASRTGGRGLVVMTRDGRVWPVQNVLASDELSDLAVLQLEGKNFTPLPLARRPAPQGAPVTVLSHPERRLYVLTTGSVSRYMQENRPAGIYRSLSITAEFARGSSGAPVCDEHGAVLGIVDNTYSIYYSVEAGQQKNFQMVIRNCVSAESLLGMVGERTTASLRSPKPLLARVCPLSH